MKVFWSDFSIKILIEIHKFYKEQAGLKIADKIKTGIFKSTKQLIKHPFSGQEELLLKSLNQGHRYIVEGNYKIIYKPIPEGILIVDIFDSRQNPTKITRKKTK